MSSAEISAILKNSYKKHGVHVGSLSSVAESVVAYSTGNLALDYIFGVNGIPEGRNTELAGLPSCGKTTTALQAAARLQKTILAGGNADITKGPIVGPEDHIFFMDYEHALDPAYAAALGLDLEHESFLFAQPDGLEDGANVSLELISTGSIRMMIVDSVAAMTPKSILDADVGKQLPAVQAKLMSDYLRKLNPLLHHNHCAAVWLNHLKEIMNMNSRPGAPAFKDSPGGTALKFYSSIRVQYTPLERIREKVVDSLTQEEETQETASNIKVKVTKNKVAAPFKTATLRVRFGKGFDNFWTAMQILLAHKQLNYASSRFYFDNLPGLVHPEMEETAKAPIRAYIHGEKKLFAFADSHPEWRQLVIEEAERFVSTLAEGLGAIVGTEVQDEESEEEVEKLLEELTTEGERVKLA